MHILKPNILGRSILCFVLRFQGLFALYTEVYSREGVYDTSIFPEVYDRCCLYMFAEESLL